MKELDIDIECYSGTSLKTSGVYRYTEDPDFEIILFGYSIDGGDVSVVDLAAGEEIPGEILSALTDKSVTKWAHNSNFERICLSAYLRRHHPEYFKSYSIQDDSVSHYLDPSSWKCSMMWASYMALPRSLSDVGSVLGLDKQKLTEGKDLIRYFCIPCRPTKTNGGRTRNLPGDAPGKWELFKTYNKRDVEVEIAIRQKLRHFPVPDSIWEEYHLDQEINDRGIMIDMPLVENAVKLDAMIKERLMSEMKELTGLENPGSVIQMRGWLSEHGVETDSLDKASVKELLSRVDPDIAKVLALRQQYAKTSVKKYQAMMNCVCADSRARGMFAFYGGSRTGRWAGRLIQLQNLAQNHMEDLSDARELVRKGDFEAVCMLYDNVPNVLSELIRTAFIPKSGFRFVVADFSAIEARVISHLASETWRVDAFREGKDIYCESASKMFGVPVVKNGVNGHLRQKGKVAELALSYGGSVGALTAMGALGMGIPEDELQPLVDAWRAASPQIVKFWWDIGRAVKNTITQRCVSETHGFRIWYRSGMLFIDLPSGRHLSYAKPRTGMNRFGSESIMYEGISTGKWTIIESYGPKICENITQAVARDILAYAMKTLSYCRIVGHVHDELIIECSKAVSLDAICEQMGRTPPWIKGLCLKADGYECEFYQKA